MRIALVTYTFLPRVGGGEYVVHNLASQWHQQGHEVCVFNAVADTPCRSDMKYDVRKYRTPFSFFKLAPHRFPFSKYCATDLQRLLADFRPDFISAHFGYPLGVWLSKITPLPKYLITCHGREITDFPWGYRHIYHIDRVLAEALNKSAGAVAISSRARELMEEIGVRPERIVDIPNGVDLPRFQKRVDFNLRRRFELSGEAMIVLSVGREHAQKAYDTGIKAFARVARRHPHLHYLILGRETDKWTALIDELDLRGRVILCEGLSGDDLVGAYQQSDIFFSPSVWELMPLVVLEALACGLPMVVTNVSGSRDIVVSGQNGWVVESGREEEMADALERLIADEALRSRLGAANRKRSEDYSWERISRMYLDHR